MTLEHTTMTMTDAVVERPERELTLIEKLEKDLEYNLAIKESRTEPLEHSHYYAYCDAMENAIDIVKQHQCTWQGKYIKASESTHYVMTCGGVYVDDHQGAEIEWLKYCPFCGGMIDLSEVDNELD